MIRSEQFGAPYGGEYFHSKLTDQLHSVVNTPPKTTCSTTCGTCWSRCKTGRHYPRVALFHVCIIIITS